MLHTDRARRDLFTKISRGGLNAVSFLFVTRSPGPLSFSVIGGAKKRLPHVVDAGAAVVWKKLPNSELLVLWRRYSGGPYGFPRVICLRYIDHL